MTRQIAASFNGIDPLKPRLREELDEARHDLQEACEHLGFLGVNVALQDPPEEVVEEMRRWVSEQVEKGS